LLRLREGEEIVRVIGFKIIALVLVRNTNSLTETDAAVTSPLLFIMPSYLMPIRMPRYSSNASRHSYSSLSNIPKNDALDKRWQYFILIPCLVAVLP
jgi:hypothetical protein